MQFEECFNKSEFILTEGGLVERLKKEFNVKLDAYINHAGLIYDNPEALTTLYQQYIDVAQKHHHPIMLMTPTRKVNAENTGKSNYVGHNIITDACTFLLKLREENQSYKENIFVGGLLGCKGDAYNAAEALQTDEAYTFHRIQVAEYAKTKVDFLFAGIIPSLSESIGIAKAMSESGIPYIVSFMVTKNGCLLDGTSIADAVRIIDNETAVRPLCFTANCIHPTNLKLALDNPVNESLRNSTRFTGIQGNASSLSPDELNNCGILKQESFELMVDEMEYLIRQYHFKLLGGCCGTNNIFIEKLAERLSTLRKA
jgi:S-methylmethionine-dependent homocysteine/selenocysteine methylase